MLLGREEELARISGIVDDAVAGRAATLLVVAEPGMGKTALLEQAASTAAEHGVRVVQASAVESESSIPGAVLDVVLDRLGVDLVDPSTPQALLGALVAAADDGPVLLVLDDVHWLDRETRRALTFALRRLLADPVAVLLAGRPEVAADPELASLPQLRIGPLPEAAAVEMLLTRRAELDVTTARRLARALAGVPLALVESAELAPADDLGGLVAGSPATVGAAVSARYAAGFEGLSEDSRTALVVLAADDGTGAPMLADTLAGAGVDLVALGPAEEAGLVLLGPKPRFVHPLARSAVWSSVPPSRRRGAHAAWAAALAERDSVRALRHRAAAAVSPDEGLAAALETEADRLAAEGLDADAAELAEAAVALSQDADARRRRLALVANTSPDPARVRRAAEVLLAEPTPSTVLAGVASAVLTLDEMGDVEMSRRLIARIDRDALRPDELDELDWNRLWSAILRCDVDGVRATAADLERRPDPQWWTCATLGWARTWVGDCRSGVAWLRRAEEMASGLDLDDLSREELSTLGMVSGLLFDPERHRVRFEAQERRARASGVPALVSAAAFLSAERVRRDGFWQRADALYAESVDLAAALGTRADIERARRGSLRASCGDLPSAREDHDVAEQARQRRSHPTYNDGWVWHLRGLLDLADRAPDRAAESFALGAHASHLGRGCRDATATCAFDLVEVLVATGQQSRARVELERIESLLEGIVDPVGLAQLERCHGLVDRDLERFEAAAVLHEQGDDPFEQARTALLHGQALRRAGRPKDARVPLEAASSAFVRLGAAPYAARAAEELRASGATTPSVEVTEPGLTPQELRVALAVCEGMSNAEVAAALFLSVKTVEFHLSSVYRKCGVRSRARLRSALESRGVL